mmetsp:Transcript_23306/g.43272  ORF Transcript_23306/g.43272 Transcript_23306/m.43272 type:complete len:282 (-) Transcript_23306:271-1116(-)
MSVSLGDEHSQAEGLELSVKQCNIHSPYGISGQRGSIGSTLEESHDFRIFSIVAVLDSRRGVGKFLFLGRWLSVLERKLTFVVVIIIIIVQCSDFGYFMNEPSPYQSKKALQYRLPSVSITFRSYRRRGFGFRRDDNLRISAIWRRLFFAGVCRCFVFVVVLVMIKLMKRFYRGYHSMNSFRSSLDQDFFHYRRGSFIDCLDNEFHKARIPWEDPASINVNGILVNDFSSRRRRRRRRPFPAPRRSWNFGLFDVHNGMLNQNQQRGSNRRTGRTCCLRGRT